MTRHARPLRLPRERVVWWRRWLAAEDGSVSAFVVIFVVALLALIGLTLDGGLALGAKVRANGQAEAAARAGAQAIDLAVYRGNGTVRLMPDQAVAGALSYLAGVGASGTVTVAGDTVTVTVTAVHSTQLLGLVGVSELRVHGVGSAHPQRGVTGIDP